MANVFQHNDRIGLPSVAAVTVAAMWGIFWIPLRRVEALGAEGPWATLLTVLCGLLAMAPFAWALRARLRATGHRAVISMMLGGAAFVLYSNALLYGQVAVVILLFYLTPIWSTLIGWLWFGWPVRWWRYLAIVLGLGGIGLVLSGSGGMPLPQSLGDWLGLASGMLWSVASTGIHTQDHSGPVEGNIIFLLGAAITALLFLPLAPALPSAAAGALPELAGWIVVLGVAWWAASMLVIVWATQRLEPARVGILFMSEVVVGALSAALYADEPFGPAVAVGAVLVVTAGLLETLPVRRERG